MWIFTTGFRLFMILFSAELSPTRKYIPWNRWKSHAWRQSKTADTGDVGNPQGWHGREPISWSSDATHWCQCVTSPLTGSLKLDQCCLQLMLQCSGDICTDLHKAKESSVKDTKTYISTQQIWNKVMVMKVYRLFTRRCYLLLEF